MKGHNYPLTVCTDPFVVASWRKVCVKDHTKLTEMTGNFSTPALLLSVTKLITNWANLTLSGRKSANSSLASSLKVGADLVNFFRCPPNARLV